MYIVQCTLYSVQITMYNVHYYIVGPSAGNVHIMYIVHVHCTVYITTLYSVYVKCSLYSVHVVKCMLHNL